MAVALLDYAPNHYNSLAHIHDASEAFGSFDALDALYTTIGKIFIKHGVEKQFGIILLHRHFPLHKEEKVVKLQNVSMPWNTGFSDALKNVMPSCWRFVSEGLASYEFMYKPSDPPAVDLKEHRASLRRARRSVKGQKARADSWYLLTTRAGQ